MQRNVQTTLGMFLLALGMLAALPSPAAAKDPDGTRRLNEAMTRSLEKAKYEQKRKAALLKDISDDGWAGFPLGRDDQAWRANLEPAVYQIAREKKDQMAVENPTLHIHDAGMLVCGACGHALFDTSALVESADPGLHFRQSCTADAVVTDVYSEWSAETGLVELRCASCGAHLGYVDPGDGPDDPLTFVISPGILAAVPPANTGLDP